MQTLRQQRATGNSELKKTQAVPGSSITVEKRDDKYYVKNVFATEDNQPVITSALNYLIKNSESEGITSESLAVFKKTGLFETVVFEGEKPASEEVRKKHSEEVQNVALELLEKRGYVFRGEQMGDKKLRESVAKLIAENFYFEGSGPDGEVQFRQIHENYLGKPITADEVMEHYTKGLLDQKRTLEKQSIIKQAFESEFKKTHKDPKTATLDELNKMQAELSVNVEEKFRQYKKVYSNKSLPAYDESFIVSEFQKKGAIVYADTATSLGVVPGTMKEMNIMNSRVGNYVSANMDKLNKLGHEKELSELAVYEPKAEWEGLTVQTRQQPKK